MSSSRVATENLIASLRLDREENSKRMCRRQDTRLQLQVANRSDLCGRRNRRSARICYWLVFLFAPQRNGGSEQKEQREKCLQRSAHPHWHKCIRPVSRLSVAVWQPSDKPVM